jgi:hypothetical protein
LKLLEFILVLEFKSFDLSLELLDFCLELVDNLLPTKHRVRQLIFKVLNLALELTDVTEVAFKDKLHVFNLLVSFEDLY